MNSQQNSRGNSRSYLRRNDETGIDLVMPTESNRPIQTSIDLVTATELTATASGSQTGINLVTPTDLETTTRPVYGVRKHFMNSVRLQPMVFSCAVDCFLEIWHVVLRFLFGEFSRSNNDLINLLSEMCLAYDQLIHDTSTAGTRSWHLQHWFQHQ